MNIRRSKPWAPGKVTERRPVRAASAALIAFMVSLASSAAPVTELAPMRMALTVGERRWELPYYASHSVSQTDSSVVRALIMIHDSSRNARSAFTAADLATSAAGSNATGTLVFAPQFLTSEDAAEYALPEAVLRWTPLVGGAEWEQGWDQGESCTAAYGAASSFSVVDALLLGLSAEDRHPELRTIIVAGLSLGAQFVNRYAAATPVVDALRTRGIDLRFVVAAPSSYLYFDELRPVSGSSAAFAIPSLSARRSCPGWNSYRYGLSSLNAYMAEIGAERLRSQYPRRNVAYLVGEDDRGGEQSCPAKLQGPDRLARMQAYVLYLQHTFGSETALRHTLSVVPGLGHTWSLFSHPTASAALFGLGTGVP